MDFVIGVLVGLAVWGITEAVRWSRKPWYIPIREDDWSEKTRSKMEKVGWGILKMGWFPESMVPQYENQGRVKIRVGWLRRECRARTRNEGDMVMMRRA